jgi:hypothetical protein
VVREVSRPETPTIENVVNSIKAASFQMSSGPIIWTPWR